VRYRATLDADEHDDARFSIEGGTSGAGERRKDS
jgi:hypothetical protein